MYSLPHRKKLREPFIDGYQYSSNQSSIILWLDHWPMNFPINAFSTQRRAFRLGDEVEMFTSGFSDTAFTKLEFSIFEGGPFFAAAAATRHWKSSSSLAKSSQGWGAPFSQEHGMLFPQTFPRISQRVGCSSLGNESMHASREASMKWLLHGFLEFKCRSLLGISHSQWSLSPWIPWVQVQVFAGDSPQTLIGVSTDSTASWMLLLQEELEEHGASIVNPGCRSQLVLYAPTQTNLLCC